MTVATKNYTPTENEIETFSGYYLDVKNPDPNRICLEDIAHALSNICRYGGQCRQFYSVAEHSVFVANRLARKGHHRKLQIMGLHHDDAEAYLGDIPRPLKPLLGATYKKLSDRMDRAIEIALDLPLTVDAFHNEDIKAADDWSVHVEARNLMTSEGRGWSGLPDGRSELVPDRIVIPDYFMGGLNPAKAEKLFLAKHQELLS